MGAPVGDTSVLNYLARLGQFSLLREQFGHLVVPRAVLAELDQCPDLPGAGCARQALSAGWMEIASQQAQDSRRPALPGSATDDSS
jgi:predicted nucleic acid-binding protein